MSAVFLDTSAFLAMILGESSGPAVRAEMQRHEIAYASGLLEAEARSAVGPVPARRHELAEYLGLLTWVLPDRPLSLEFDELEPLGPLRGADRYHLACALYLSGKGERLPILTLDRAQARVAAAAGFPVKGVS